MHRVASRNPYERSNTGLFAAGMLAVVVTASAALLQPAEAQAPPAGSFTSGGSLGADRNAHGAALLNNGLVLFYGSRPGAELYDPVTQRTEFLSAPNSDVLYLPTMTTLRDGRVLIAGGLREAGANQPDVPTASAVLFDPAARTWSTAGPMTVARALHTATLLADGRVLIVGGVDKPTGTTATAASLRTTEVFDPATGRFTASAALPDDTALHTATLLKDGRVLISSDSAYLFDPTRGTVSTLASTPSARLGARSVLLEDGTVLLVGGQALGQTLLARTAQRFDPATGRFEAAGNLAQGRQYHSATLRADGRVLVVGGHRGGTGTGLALNTTEIFDPATNSWSAGPNLATARWYHTATSLPDGRVVVAGGYDGTNSYPSIEVYTPPVPAKPYAGSAPAAGSQSLLVTTRVATAEDLVKALATDGCSARVIAYLQAGTWRIYLPGAPTVVNAAFPASLPATTPLFIGCN